MGWACARMEEGTRAFKILTGKPIEKKPIGRLRHRTDLNTRH